MVPKKFSKPNGFSSDFYQKHWNVIGEEINGTVLKLLYGDGMVPSFNNTYIILIPKKV